jgi:hypothetical protein
MAQPTTPDLTVLLQRHLPLLRYDSQEPYFADSAAEWTDNPGNTLTRADGTVLAAATPAAGQKQLSLSLLAQGAYSDGTPASHDDRVGDPSRDYVSQARAMHAQDRYANRIYGHWATASDGRTWLAYWFFYFYNDYNLVGPLLPAGLHEGDWEMIQLRLDDAAQVPDLAVYAQHKAADARAWEQVERVGERPVVYPARGSHASYFGPGVHWTGFWFDHADGRRSGRDCTLETVLEDDPSYHWAHWPGMWGDTEPKPGIDGLLDDSSPRGPGAHAQWKDPRALLLKAKDHEAVKAAAPALALNTLPAAPTVSVAREGSHLIVEYVTTNTDVVSLIVAVNSPQEPLSPALYREPITTTHGKLDVPAALHDDSSYDIHVSAATQDGRASSSTAAQLPPGPVSA